MKFHDANDSKSTRTWNFAPDFPEPIVFEAIDVQSEDEVAAVLDELVAMFGKPRGSEGTWSSGFDRYTSKFDEMLEYSNGKFHVCGYTRPTITYHFEVAFRDQLDAMQFKLTYC